MNKVIVIEILGPIVKFSTSIGVGAGIWLGSAPEIASEYDIEMDLDVVFEWGKNIFGLAHGIPFIGIEGQEFQGIARVESIENGVLIVSFVGSIVMMEVYNMSDVSKYVYFKVSVGKVSLYPVEL